MGEYDVKDDSLLIKLPRAESDLPRAGNVIIHDRLGRGGMGAVYLGRDVKLNVPVAVKVIPPHLLEANPDLVLRFQREAQTAARVDHPNLMRVYTVDQEEGVNYLVLEFVDGESVAERLKREGPLPEADALDICIAAGDALAAAHARGIVHRDIKPANIMIRHEDGRVKLADLGLAKSFHEQASKDGGLTATGQVIGTPAYMSPEQAKDASQVDPRTDVYSLGATLYALLGGRAPHQASQLLSLLMKVANEEPRGLKETRPELSDAACDVTRRMMAKAPGDRIATMAGAVALLKKAREALGVSSAGLGRPQLAGARLPAELAGMVSSVTPVTARTAPAKPPAPEKTLEDVTPEELVKRPMTTPAGEPPAAGAGKKAVLVPVVLVLLGVGLIAGFLYVAAKARERQEKIASLVAEASDAEKAGELEKAVRLFERAAGLGDESAPAEAQRVEETLARSREAAKLVEKARALSAEGKLEEAKALVEESLELDARSTQARELLASVEGRMARDRGEEAEGRKEFKEALEHYRKAAERGVDVAEKLAFLEEGLGPRVVARHGEAKFRTIGEAMSGALPGATILVKPGVYAEGVVIDKPVEIVGGGQVTDVVIESDDSDCILMEADRAVVRGLTLRCRAGSKEKRFFGVDVPQGRLVLEDCDVTSDSLACVAIHGEGTDSVVRRCKIRDGKAGGIFVWDKGKATMEDCDVYGNALAGVEVGEDGVLTAGGCKMHHGKSGGALVHGGGKATFEDCDIYTNALAGVEIADGGDVLVRNCKIHDGAGGVYFYKTGKGTIEECHIFSMELAGVQIGEGADPVIRGCKIHDGKAAGIYIDENGRGTIEDCDIYANALAGVEVNGGGDPVVKGCRIYDGKSTGVLVSDKGRGRFEDCDIRGCALAGVAIGEGGNPLLRKCRIHDGQTGVLIYEDGRGTVEDCDVFGNAMAGIEMKQGADPLIRNCRIYDGKAGGVFAYENAKGTVEDCDVYANALAGVEISESATTVVRKCKIHDGKQGGVLVHGEGKGTLDDCHVFGNSGAGVAIETLGDPLIRRCEIRDGQNGLFVYENGRGTLEDCRIFRNALSGVAIQEGGDPTLRRCRVYDGKDVGVVMMEGGAGTLEDCDVYGNALAGVEVRDASEPVVNGCRINRNGGSAVFVHTGGAGSFEGCDLTGNKLGAWDIEEGCEVLRVDNKE